MSYSTPPPPPPPPNPYGGAASPYAAPDHPRSTLILVLGILSLVCCGLLTGLPAIFMGRSALKEIDASGGSIGGRGNVKAGYICGIIGTILSALGLLLYIALFALAIGGGAFDTTG